MADELNQTAEKIKNDPKFRAEWKEWLDDQLNTTNNASYTQTGNNRVFLTEEDDIDIARYTLNIFSMLIDKLD